MSHPTLHLTLDDVRTPAELASVAVLGGVAVVAQCGAGDVVRARDAIDIARAVETGVDVVVIDLRSGGAEEALTIALARADGRPVIVVSADPASIAPLLRRGVTDVVLADAVWGLEGRILTGVHRAAIVHRQSQLLERERRRRAQAERLHLDLDHIEHDSAEVPLAQRAPAAHRRAVMRMMSHVDAALEAGDAPSPGLRSLAAELAAHTVGPRDVVAVYSDAARGVGVDPDEDRASAALDEARYATFELLGNITAMYRARLAPPVTDATGTRHRFVLYVAGDTSQARAAIANLQRVGAAHLEPHPGFDLEIVDVVRDPARAQDEFVLVTPTLDRLAPGGRRRLTGDLSSPDAVTIGLGLERPMAEVSHG